MFVYPAGKFQTMFTQPTRRIGFEYLDRFCNRYIWREGEQQMYVIRNSSGSEDRDAAIASDSREIFVETRV
jgi:hypothetical protein